MKKAKKLTLEGLLDIYIKDAKVQGQPATEWLQSNSKLGSLTSGLNRVDLLRLLDKAYVAIGHIQQESIDKFQEDEGLLGSLSSTLEASKNALKQIDEVNKVTAFISYERGLKDSRSANSSKGGKAKSEKYGPLKELAKELVEAKKWPSRRNAAMTIAPEIIKKSKEIGVSLSESQAVDTITGWLKDLGLPRGK